MSDGRAVRLFETALGVLARPRVRRLRRWAFVVTIPTGYLVGRAAGVNPGTGFVAGLVVGVLELALLLALLVAGARVLGRERRDLVLDLVMHPAVRRSMRAEIRNLLVLPRAVVRYGRPRAGEFGYHRRTFELGFALALVPAMLAEGAAVHLLLSRAPVAVRVVVAGLHAYGVLMLLGLALGPRVHPHRVASGRLELNTGSITRATIVLERIAEVRTGGLRRGGRTGLLVEDGTALLLSGGRADVLLRLHEPVLVARVLRDPVEVTAIAVAVDDPAGFIAAIDRARESSPPPAQVGRRGGSQSAAWLPVADVLDAITS